VCLALASSASLTTGCASGSPANAQEAAAAAPYRVGPSDVITIRVLPEPAMELDDLQVRPDGRISVELIGDVPAEGRTTDEIAAEITERIAEFRQSPSVTVSVQSPASTTVSIVGEVKAPGSFPLERNIRVSELVAMAGGQTELSATSRVRIVRREGAESQLLLADLDDIKRGDASTDVLLRKGDFVVVPSAYPVVAGYEIRKVLYPIEALMRVLGAGLFALVAGN
jgi:polysaccharide export outer membrane protein